MSDEIDDAELEAKIFAIAPGLGALKELLDTLFSESGERRRFMVYASMLGPSDLAALEAVLQEKARGDPDDLVASLDDPMNFGLALMTREEALSSSTNRLRLDVTARLLETPGLLEGVHDRSMGLWFPAQQLARNRCIDATSARIVWRTIRDQYDGMIDAEDVLDLARNPNTPSDVLQELVDTGNEAIQKSVARYGDLSDALTRALLGTRRRQVRCALACSRRVPDSVIASLCEDDVEAVRKKANREWSRRHGEATPSKAVIAEASRALDALQPRAAASSDEELVERYTHDPEAWPNLIQDSSAGPKLLRAGFRDGRDPRPSPFYRKKANKNIGYVAKLLPRGKALYEKASRTDNELFLVACLLRLEEAKDVDDRLVAALRFNPRLRELGPRALTDRVGIGVWNWDYVETSSAYPTRTKSILGRL